MISKHSGFLTKAFVKLTLNASADDLWPPINGHKWPGSVHDACILRESLLGHEFEQGTVCQI